MGAPRLSKIVLAVALLFMTSAAGAQAPAAGTVLFDSHPEHLWNRLHALFFVRQYGDAAYGGDALDPMLWPDTKYLFEGPSHAQAVALLDEFLRTHGER